jgi:hypothetical protein
MVKNYEIIIKNKSQFSTTGKLYAFTVEEEENCKERMGGNDRLSLGKSNSSWHDFVSEIGFSLFTLFPIYEYFLFLFD